MRLSCVWHARVRRCAAFCTDKDEGVRADTALEGLAKLKPAFSAYANHPSTSHAHSGKMKCKQTKQT
jgi:acetyl-CoA acetyltransferase